LKMLKDRFRPTRIWKRRIARPVIRWRVYKMSRELFDAIERHDLEALAVLLAGGADPNYLAQDLNYYPLHAAIFELDFGGPIAAIEQLISAGADVNRIDSRIDGAPPLLAALLDGQTEAARRLLLAGADPNIVGKLGDSPLHVSIDQGDAKTVALLLNHGADKTINEARGILGRNPLEHAVSLLDPVIVELLLKAGADPTALDDNDRTARQLMPPRTDEDAPRWDRVAALLKLSQP
jgi:ankyrin repeat protein